MRLFHRPSVTTLRRPRRHGLTVLSAALLALPPLAAARADNAPPAFSEVVNVRAINVEVVVTDRDGVRAHDLGPDAFRLRVDGEERPIDYFAEIRGGDVIRAESLGGTPPGALAGVEPGEPRGTSYLVFIDDYFSIAADRDYVLGRLQEELPQLRPEDRMAIVAFDGERLEMLTSWTGSQQQLEDALRRARALETHGLARLGELRTNDRLLESRFHLFRRPFRTDLDGLERDFALRLASQVEASVRAASATLRGFAFPPGRKVMLLLSGGWPFSPAEYTVDTYLATFEDTLAGTLDTGVPGRSRLYEPLTTTANLLGYTLYPVDVPGIDPSRGADASRSLPSTATARSSLDREDQVEETLVHLALETGGEALINGRRAEPLTTVARDTASYYWIGFNARRDESDDRHDIAVEVLRPGLQVRTRDDYVDLSRARELDLATESALLFGSPPSGTPLEIRVGKLERTGSARGELELEIGIPMSEILLQGPPGARSAELELRIQALGPGGAISDTAHRSVEVRGEGEPGAGQLFWYATTLKLRPRTERIVVAVYDPVGGAVLSNVIDLSG